MARIYLPTSTQMDEMNANLLKIAAAISGNIRTDDWNGIQQAVRSGVAKELFPIGSQIVVPHAVYGDQVFDVVAHDYLKSALNPTAHTMTLLSHYSIGNFVFDAPEAFYTHVGTEPLPAGTYNFTIPTTYSNWAAGTYQFTLANALPKGGQLCVSGYADKAMTTLKVNVYANATTTTATESVTITEGNNGTPLGEFHGTLNHEQRVSYGSNNYGQSAVRQFLNSEAAAGSVWRPQTKFDRPPSWAANTAGYMNGLSAEFKAIVGAVNLPCSTNNTYESPDSAFVQNSAYTLKDKFYLVSRKEVFGSSDDVDDGSVQLPYYVGSANVDRVKTTNNGSAADWWVRTPNRYHAYGVRLVNSDGSLSSNSANYSNGVVPACTIM